jgi:glycosyltransferase involved in cell wall biosynthesis
LVAIIIPAYNEERRIGAVLRAATSCKLADEVIVVSDASADRTAAVARLTPGVRVVELRRNQGKGGAMVVGAKQTQAEVLVFLDADLRGLNPEHIDSIIRPLVEDKCDMCIGVFRGGKFWSNTAHRVSPTFSGQRALRRDLFDRIPLLADMRLGVEVAINTYAKRNRAKVLRVVLRGVSNTHKERKLGFMKGTAARARMYAEIGRAVVRARRRRKSYDRQPK